MLTEAIKRSMQDEISKSILDSLKGTYDPVSEIQNKAFTKDDMDNLIEALKPKQIVVTSSQDIYDGLIKLPDFNEKNLILSPGIEGTIIVDMERLGTYGIHPKDVTSHCIYPDETSSPDPYFIKSCEDYHER